MKKLALTVTLLALWAIEPVHAAEFFCPSGDVTCLIAAINNANGMPGAHVINLEPGSYTLQVVDNITDGPNGLPSIKRSILIQATAEDLPTVIERDLNLNAPQFPFGTQFRIFHVSVAGELELEGVTVQRGSLIVPPLGGNAIFNRGVTTLRDSIVTDNIGEEGAILNIGTLNVLRTVIADNGFGHEAGGINNAAGGNVVVENSTIAHNAAIGAGGILNRGSLVVRNSAIIFNSTDCCQPGGGILNVGSLEIVNSTIAKNVAGQFSSGGGGIFNSGGLVSITNSTVRENRIAGPPSTGGGGIQNQGGIFRIQNTIVASNLSGSVGFSPDCRGTITSLGNNLVGDPSGCDINLQPSDLTGDPGLGSLVGGGEDDLPGRAYYPVLAGSPIIERGNPNACLQSDQLGNLRVGICDIGAVEFQGKMLVSVDVRPRRNANKINPNSTNNINVAIFSTNGFDATAVDPSTIRFGATGTEAAPVHVGRRDVNGDGQRDMVVRFAIQDTGIKCGNTSATLTGQISSGQSIIGSSSIQTVQCGKTVSGVIASGSSQR